MSLNWDVSEIDNHKHVTTSPQTRNKQDDEQKWHPVTEALVWLSMFCGFNKIDAANADEVCKRVAAYQAAFGPYLNSGSGGVYVTDADVKLHIGLRTNASSKTPAQFKSSLGKGLYDDGAKSWANNNRRLAIVNEHGWQEKSAYDICEELYQKQLKKGE